MVTKEMADVVVTEGDNVVTVPPPTCPICLDPVTCAGGHRICCIPCGHVYGRSCLERWLYRSALNSAKCPQCGEQFEGNVIINLYAPENLWDGCLQDFKAYYKAAMKEREGYYLSVVTEYMEKTKLELDKMEAEYSQRMTRVKERMRKMAEEENATPKDLVEFLELSYP